MLSFDPDDARYLSELAEFVGVPSVSRDADAGTMRAAAQWLAGQLRFAGGRVGRTDGPPPVPGGWLGAPRAPPVLVYGHHYVQPTPPPTARHQGGSGGPVASRLHARREILAGRHEGDGTVAVAGFSDGTAPLTAERRRQLAAVSFSEPQYLRELGLAQAHGEAGYSTLERLWERPTLDVNGIRGGGKYTVIPRVAVGHVSCRLVPGQDPDKVIEAITAHVSRAPAPGTRLTRHPD